MSGLCTDGQGHRARRGHVRDAGEDGLDALAAITRDGLAIEMRQRADGAMAFAASDLLTLGGQSVMREPWTARRKRLKDRLEVDARTDDRPLVWRGRAPTAGVGAGP